MIDALNSYNPFDRLIGRDNDNWTRPDVSFLRDTEKVPVAGLCLVRAQREYGERQKHDRAGDLLRGLARRNGLALIELDTEWPEERNVSGLASPEAFESVCARMDVMLTTRLHGTVLSLKNGIPVIAIDAISGGGKVLRQAQVVGWPEAFSIDRVTDDVLDEALARCLQPSGKDRARSSAASARQLLDSFSHDFAEALSTPPEGKPSFTGLAQRPSRFQRKLKKMTGKLAHLMPGRAN
jgi:hypothetical protein